MLAIDGLACPACRGDLQADGEAQLICQGCQATYPLFEGIPSFIPAPTRDRPASYQLTVVIPALNEAQNLPLVLIHIPPWVHEVLLVDGQSTDGTINVAQQQCPTQSGKELTMQLGQASAQLRLSVFILGIRSVIC